MTQWKVMEPRRAEFQELKTFKKLILHSPLNP